MVGERGGPPAASETLFHICADADWRAGEAAGAYAGSAVDRRDGFIHLSTAAQLPGTAGRHFAGRHGLVVLEIRRPPLEPALRWEPAPDGTPFPHHYGPIDPGWIAAVHPLPIGPDGRHRFLFLPST